MVSCAASSAAWSEPSTRRAIRRRPGRRRSSSSTPGALPPRVTFAGPRRHQGSGALRLSVGVHLTSAPVRWSASVELVWPENPALEQNDNAQTTAESRGARHGYDGRGHHGRKLRGRGEYRLLERTDAGG